MNQKKTSKKLATQISAKVEKRIVDVSLRHLGFGARRLVPLLKKEKIAVSASRVYGILKRHKIQTRALRQAKLKKQTKKPKPSHRKSPVRIPAAVEEHIVELSLQHPDFGAHRLVPLLKKGKKSIAASTVYNILKRRGLQNREKRLAQIKKQTKKPKPSLKKFLVKTPAAVEEQIIRISLQHPDYGARRLVPLLKKEKISFSANTVYTILRRRGLQTQAKRLAKLKERPKKKAHTRKKIPAKISAEVIERIEEISLQHPDYGSHRLVPLLKQEEIDVSASRVYTILKQKGLQTLSNRLQKLEEQRADQAPPLKKLADTVPSEMEERVKETVLQHPDCGAQRLADVLKEEDILVSEAAVSKLLKSHGLENRDARLMKLEERYLVENISLTEDQVLMLEAFNPSFLERHLESKYPGNLLCQDVMAVGRLEGFGQIYLHVAVDTFGSVAFGKIANNEKPETAVDLTSNRVLPFYREHDFPILAILTEQDSPFTGDELHPFENLLALNEIEHRLSEKGIVKTNGFLERFKRTAFEEFFADAMQEKTYQELKEVQADFDVWLDHYNAERPYLGYPNMGSTPMEMFRAAKQPVPETIPDTAVVAPPAPRVIPVPKALVKSTKRSHWAFYLFNLLLLALIAYLGFNAVLNIQQSRTETKAVAAVKPAAARTAAKPDIPAQPLQVYRKIWERNLFNISKEKESAPEDKISLEKLTLAKKTLGLKLVGTVVADDPMISRAIIDNRKTREQEAYREGDNAGNVQIKKILRNKVVITTAKGDELLTIEPEEFGKGRQTHKAQQQAAKSSTSRQLNRKSRTISLERQEVEDSLADLDGLTQQMRISPHMQGDQPAGFKIGKIPRNSVLAKMGLRSGDVITGVDDETITDPEQAADFLQRLAQGGETTIMVKRRRRTRQIRINIE